MNNYNPFSLEGKTVLVTGASSGIGRATAIECSRMGATVVVTGRNSERLQETLEQLEGTGHQSFLCEMTRQEDVEALVANVPALHGVVLCAGRSRSLPILFSTREKFDEIFDVNFFSPVELLRLLCKKKKLTGPSSAVFIVSIGGTKRWTPGNAIYGASKAALQAVVNYYAVELGHKKIRVNGINPGMVETPLIHHGTLTQEQLDADRLKYPLERYGQPDDIAHAAIYLLSDASSWMTGHCMVIDGGITAR
ncbi:MAG: SDR family oxidoreductase [Prevotella sp.]|nr:SDR family oxidoreductase [Prevotella sp.]